MNEKENEFISPKLEQERNLISFCTTNFLSTILLFKYSFLPYL